MQDMELKISRPTSEKTITKSILLYTIVEVMEKVDLILKAGCASIFVVQFAIMVIIVWNLQEMRVG